MWAWDLYHSIALVEAAKSSVPLNVKAHGKVLHQKSRLKSMVHSVHLNVLLCNVQCQLNMTGEPNSTYILQV